MIDPLLLSDLTDFLNKVVKDYVVEDENGVQWPVLVVQGWLPPKRTTSDEADEGFCIMARYEDGEADFNVPEDQSKSINRVSIAVRTTSNDVQMGPQNTINLMAMIQRRIYEHPILNKRYRATFPMKWTAPVGHTWPIWEGTMTIPYYVPMIQEIFIGGLYNE
jgi:hypothetical protein